MHFPISRSRTRKSILNYEGIVYFNFNFSCMCNVVIFVVQYMKNAVIPLHVSCMWLWAPQQLATVQIAYLFEVISNYWKRLSMI